MQLSMWKNIFIKRNPDSELLDMLRQIPIFSAMSSREVKEVQRLLYHRKYRNGEFVFKEGDPGIGMYIVVEGEVRIVLHRDDKDHEITRLRRGEFFGEISLADASDRTASAIASADTELVGFFRPELLRLLDIKSAIAAKVLLKIAEVLGERLRFANRAARPLVAQPIPEVEAAS